MAYPQTVTLLYFPIAKLLIFFLFSLYLAAIINLGGLVFDCIGKSNEMENVQKVKLLCFNLYNDNEYFRSFILKDKKTNSEYPNYLEVSFLELFKGVSALTRLKATDSTNFIHALSGKDQWILFLATKNKEVQQQLAENNTTLHAAYERLTVVVKLFCNTCG